MEPPMQVAVIGAGLMRHGIAQVFAVNGHAVRPEPRLAKHVAAAKAGDR